MNTSESEFKFRQFDVVSDVSDHYFLSSGLPKIKGSTSKYINKSFYNSFYNKITKEWRILQAGLPQSIFVRVYETRIDLLRAAIVGAAGTPYHDALFIFDIAFPATYPNQPPKVHYHSYGHRINPNLYDDGFVCLSLLNTWQGRQSERWNPSQSTLLQVLLSIQSLVLNQNPFFNEPGNGNFMFSSKTRLMKWSQQYNQDAFILTCKTTINLIRNPPKNFEPLVNSHYRERADAILAACEAYANGTVSVGYYGHDNGSGTVGVTVPGKFLANMKEMYSKLVDEFRRVGAPVRDSAGISTVESRSEAIAKPEREGIIRKMIKKIKNFLF